MHAARRPIMFAGLIPLAGLGACVASNDRLTLGDETTLGRSVVVEALDHQDAAPRTTPADDAPSLTGLDRSNWAARDYAVPFDGTHHRPHYRGDTSFTRVTARQRNQFPTALSALELNGDERGDSVAFWQRLAEVGAMPLIAVGEGALIPFRLIGEPQSLEEWSPTEPYERAPNWSTLAQERPAHPQPQILPGPVREPEPDRPVEERQE